jgi:CHASE2 domain-containing sensor protein
MLGTLCRAPPDDEDRTMDALNTLRAILVGCAFVAAVLLTFQGQWFPAAVMFAGIAAHGGLWVYLRAQKRRDAANDPLHGLLEH